jgi:molybdenum cofactor synthesis domain-containing protein
MRPLRKTISLDDARALIERTIVPIERTERVPLIEANGRVNARDVDATADVPPFARAAMDGYAVVAEDTFGAAPSQPRTLACIEAIYTGHMPERPIARGQCAEIATGAPLPDGADAVVMVEATGKEDDRIQILSPVPPGQHVTKQGADITAGQVVLARGDVLNPSRLGALGALGCSEVELFVRPTVAIMSTGNEVVAPGRPLAPGQVYDINRITLSAIVHEHGGEPVIHPTAPDALPALTRAFDACLSADLVVLSGGSSVGERDLILDVVRERGTVLFHGIAVKPGKPTLFGVVDGKPVLGMPGYPTSCLSNGYILLVPLLRQMARLPPHAIRSVRVPLAQRIVSVAGRHQIYTVRVVDHHAVPAFKASGDITSMSRADGYIEIPAETDLVEPGDVVEVKLF